MCIRDRAEVLAAQKFARDQAEYVRTLNGVPNVDRLLVRSERGMNGDDIKIIVNNEWHFQPFQVRLQLAQRLWQIWAGVHSPNNPDKAFISLVDRNGNSVGGSSSLAGSIVHVDE